MKKKGFTLIELLAVIIIIAVIAIITVPTILGVIDKSRKAAYKDSVYGIIDSARIYLTMNQENIKPGEEIEFVCNGISCSRENNGDKLEFKGEVPKSGSIYLYGDGNVLVESVYNGKYYANNETGEVVITEDDTTLTRGELTQRLINLENKYNTEVTALKNEVVSLNDQISNLKNNTTSIDKVYPVGSIYISTSNVDPATLFKGTEWVRYAEDRTLVGTSGEVEKEGGKSSITLTEGQLPSHGHSFKPEGTIDSSFSGTAVTSGSTGSGYTIGYTSATRTTSTTGNHAHAFTNGGNALVMGAKLSHNQLPLESGFVSGPSSWFAGMHKNVSPIANAGNHDHTVSDAYANSISGVQAHTHNVTASGTVSSTFTGTAGTTGNTGSGSSINIMNPYVTVYMWKRVK